MVLKEQRSHVCLWGVHYEQRLSWGLETRVMKNIIYIDHKRHWQVAENHDFSCVYPIKYIKKIHLFDLLGHSDTKESACSAGDPGLIPGLGRSPEEGNDYPLQYSFLKNSTDRGAWWATVHGVAKSRTWPSNSHTYTWMLYFNKKPFKFCNENSYLPSLLDKQTFTETDISGEQQKSAGPHKP